MIGQGGERRAGIGGARELRGRAPRQRRGRSGSRSETPLVPSPALARARLPAKRAPQSPYCSRPSALGAGEGRSPAMVPGGKGGLCDSSSDRGAAATRQGSGSVAGSGEGAQSPLRALDASSPAVFPLLRGLGLPRLVEISTLAKIVQCPRPPARPPPVAGPLLAPLLPHGRRML